MTAEPYFFFDGNCAEALAFYAQALGGTIVSVKRHRDVPGDVDPARADLVMHAQFEAPGFRFMASDGQELAQGPSRRAVLSLNCETAEEGRALFDALAAGGTVDEPYAAQFWGQSFGMVIDKYLIVWMVTGGAS